MTLSKTQKLLIGLGAAGLVIGGVVVWGLQTVNAAKDLDILPGMPEWTGGLEDAKLRVPVTFNSPRKKDITITEPYVRVNYKTKDSSGKDVWAQLAQSDLPPSPKNEKYVIAGGAATTKTIVLKINTTTLFTNAPEIAAKLATGEKIWIQILVETYAVTPIKDIFIKAPPVEMEFQLPKIATDLLDKLKNLVTGLFKGLGCGSDCDCAPCQQKYHGVKGLDGCGCPCEVQAPFAFTQAPQNVLIPTVYPPSFPPSPPPVKTPPAVQNGGGIVSPVLTTGDISQTDGYKPLTIR